MIKTKKQFKNKYIDLSNKELNGEVTEEVYDKLIICFQEIGCDTHQFNKFEHSWIYVCYESTSVTNKTYEVGDWGEGIEGMQEVSIHDIKGMTKPTAEEPKYITTHEELLKLHGKKVTCKISSYFIADARVMVGGFLNQHIYICQNFVNGSTLEGSLGYRFNYDISNKGHNEYDDNNHRCTEIQLIEEENNIDLMYDKTVLEDIKEMMKEEGLEPTAKPKTYTIEDLKTNKIAVHLPTQEKIDNFIKFCEKTESPLFKDEDDYLCIAEGDCIAYDKQDSFIYSIIDAFKEQSYTIITLDQLQIEEEYETEEQIQGGFTKEMIDHLSKDAKYQTTLESIKKMIEELTEKEIAKIKEEEKPKTMTKREAIEKRLDFRYGGEDIGYLKSFPKGILAYKLFPDWVEVPADEIIKGLDEQVEIIKE